MERNTIVVYGASSQDVEQVFSDASYRLGQLIAHSGKRLVSGAGATGLMAAVEDGVLSAGGTAIGIIPQFMVDNGWLHQGLTEVIITADMHERKNRMANMADAVIALPGGTGTFEELFEIITWKMLGLFVKPVIILNTDHYYDPLLQMLDCTADRGFMNPLFRKLWAVADDPDQAIALVDSIPDWNDLTTKLPTQK
ncbi:MAG: TIGR00730 family Rossman fold protein [Bacteroidaceae bacterium]|nr:TIGR00730 family Rossman fold protein [Bacteroidaceae bacterium]